MSQPSAETRWSRIRESSASIPSEPSTPAPQTFQDEILSGTEESHKSGRSSRRNSESVGEENASLNIDADDEDVKIAIMALGAMKNLDGKSRSGSEEDREVRRKDGGSTLRFFRRQAC